MDMTMKLLSHLSDQASGGQPLWAVLTANEYLEAGNGIRAALARKAKSALLRSGADWAGSDVAGAIFNGARISDLPEEIRAAILERSRLATTGKNTAQRQRFVCALRNRLENEARNTRRLLTREPLSRRMP